LNAPTMRAPPPHLWLIVCSAIIAAMQVIHQYCLIQP